MSEIKINYVVYTTVEKMEDVKELVRSYKNEAGEVITEMQSLGWFIKFEGSHESVHFGGDKPPFNLGDKVKITFEKV